MPKFSYMIPLQDFFKRQSHASQCRISLLIQTTLLPLLVPEIPRAQINLPDGPFDKSHLRTNIAIFLLANNTHPEDRSVFEGAPRLPFRGRSLLLSVLNDLFLLV